MTHYITAEQARDARDWLLDIGAKPSHVKRLRNSELIVAVDRLYDGGWAQFIEDGQYSGDEPLAVFNDLVRKVFA